MVQIDFNVQNKVFHLSDMNANDLLNPGTELHDLKYDGFLDWFVSVTDPRIHWQHQPTYVISQFAFLFGGLATLIHALKRGGRLPWLWLGVILHGFVVECLSYISPDIDNFWHSQTFIIFFARRLPLHIIFLYACFLYNSSVAVAKMKLPKWAEPFAVGLVVVLIDIPYDIVSVRFAHWFWHDTDPNIYDRHYYVPWNSYYFHTTFAASFTFWFHYFRRLMCPSNGKWICSKSVIRELFATMLAAVMGPIGGIILFLPIYHPLHDGYKIHSEVTFFILFTISLVIIWSADRKPRNESTKSKTKLHWTTKLICLHLIIHYSSFLSMTIFFNPEDEIATGVKETIGPCDEYSSIMTASGKILSKRKYLCPTDYDEKYFDWSCLPGKKPPSNGARWYTACGVPFENRAEYIVIISLLCFLAANVFYQLHFRSSGDDVYNEKNRKEQNAPSKQALKQKKRA
ncbi:uncharacterized protein LOC143199182 [Rhynchophorus ferrugineus]|uniref:uncharacterized protein LOC143199182 n=1 Tax=Rhynchophorus ferrugineus TaxID=354439 RepID=UPI003FCC51FA